MTVTYADLQRRSIQTQLAIDRDRQKAAHEDGQRVGRFGFDMLTETVEPVDPVVPADAPDPLAERVIRARARRNAVMAVEVEFRLKRAEVNADLERLKIEHREAIRAVQTALPL